MDATELCYTPATEIARLIRARAVSPVEVTRTVLEAIAYALEERGVIAIDDKGRVVYR